MNQLKNIWMYRFFIVSSIKTEFKARFVRSRLGGVWMIVNPLAQVAIYALVLSAVLSAKLPGIDSQYAYAIYLMAGMLGWSLFLEVFSRSLNIFLENANLIKKMAFPKMALPLVVTGTALINNIFLFVAMLVVFGLLGHIPTLALLWLPVLIIITLALALGLGLMFGILNVFIRDVGQIMPILLQFWFWLTPVVYVATILPEAYQDILYINPMTGIVVSYQNILVYGKSVDLSILMYPSLVAIISIVLSLFMYLRANEDMADVL